MRKVLYILSQLTDSDAEWLAKAGELVRVQAGTELIAEGAPLDSVFILIDGGLRVSMRKMGDVAELGAGEIVGELSLVDSRPASASVTAIRPSAVLKLSKARLVDKMEHDLGFGMRFYKAISGFLSDRMRATIERMGYGADAGRVSLAADTHSEDEIDADLLDNVHLAGARFERLFKSLLDSAIATR